jgi:hypothetical protein
VSALNSAAAYIQGGADNFIDGESFASDGGADDVHQGVCGANFVEMNLIEGDVVDLGLGST